MCEGSVKGSNGGHLVSVVVAWYPLVVGDGGGQVNVIVGDRSCLDASFGVIILVFVYGAGQSGSQTTVT